VIPVSIPRAARPGPGDKKPSLLIIVGTADAAAALHCAAVLPALAAAGPVTLLSGVDDVRLKGAVEAPVRWVFPLITYPERRLLRSFRTLVDDSPSFILPILAGLERRAAVRLRPAWDRDEVAEVLEVAAPSLILNCSPVALSAADLPVRLAREHNIPTAACILSGDDLHSRSRLINQYEFYCVADRPMRDRLLGLLPGLSTGRVIGGEDVVQRGDLQPAATAFRAFATWWHDGRTEEAARL